MPEKRSICPEEQRIFDGLLFCPNTPELKALKQRAHRLSAEYSRTPETDVEARRALLAQILGEAPEGCGILGPVFFHYGVHTRIGRRFFSNCNLTIQDDALVTIGDDNNFGPNVTIATPLHPFVVSERRQMLNPQGEPARVCYAKPVTLGNDVWLCANVTICGGVTIGDGCVIGAGSVVTRDIPAHSFAAGVPCRVIRPITAQDSMALKPEILGGYSPIPEEE